MLYFAQKRKCEIKSNWNCQTLSSKVDCWYYFYIKMLFKQLLMKQLCTYFNLVHCRHILGHNMWCSVDLILPANCLFKPAAAAHKLAKRIFLLIFVPLPFKQSGIANLHALTGADVFDVFYFYILLFFSHLNSCAPNFAALWHTSLSFPLSTLTDQATQFFFKKLH